MNLCELNHFVLVTLIYDSPQYSNENVITMQMIQNDLQCGP